MYAIGQYSVCTFSSDFILIHSSFFPKGSEKRSDKILQTGDYEKLPKIIIGFVFTFY
jgi:hypothetical protein